MRESISKLKEGRLTEFNTSSLEAYLKKCCMSVTIATITGYNPENCCQSRMILNHKKAPFSSSNDANSIKDEEIEEKKPEKVI